MYRAQVRSLKAVRRRKAWLQRKRKSQLGVSKRRRAFYESKKRAFPIKAPKNFSIKRNSHEVFKFIADLKGLKDRRNISEVFIELEHCTYISSGAIALMIAAINELKDIEVTGSYPKDKGIKTVLEKSGFFNFVMGNVSEENKVSLNTIIQKGVASVDASAVAPLVVKAMNFLRGRPYRNPRIQSLLVELMANTVNHAFLKTKNSKWILSMNCDEENNKVAFTFIDNGQGILHTLNLKFKNLIKSLLLNSNEDILLNAFYGKFGSRTNQRKRGRGLPNIKRCFSENYIKNLVVISNDVYLDFEGNQTKKLKHAFDGTCYYWEVDLTCEQWNIL